MAQILALALISFFGLFEKLATGFEVSCIIDICDNGGICTIVYHVKICSCLDGYTGQYCEEVIRPTTTTTTTEIESTTTEIESTTTEIEIKSTTQLLEKSTYLILTSDQQETTRYALTTPKGLQSTEALLTTTEQEDEETTRTSTLSQKVQTTNTQSTSNIPTTVTAPNCTCLCGKPNTRVPLDPDEFKVVRVNKEELSSFRRKRTCANDPRKSAQYIGFLGSLVLISTFVFIVILDLKTRNGKTTVGKTRKKGHEYISNTNRLERNEILLSTTSFQI